MFTLVICVANSGMMSSCWASVRGFYGIRGCRWTAFFQTPVSVKSMLVDNPEGCDAQPKEIA